MAPGGWLLDTNVLSELRKGVRCNPSVRRWVDGVSPQSCCISVVTIVEIQRGIEMVSDPIFRAELANWLTIGVAAWFRDRIFPADSPVLRCWVDLIAQAKGQGRSWSQPDGLIAATAIVHRCCIVTRNTSDFAMAGVPLLNPWQA
jgi:toxin FitB